MAEIRVMLYVNGSWSENLNFDGFSVVGVLIPTYANFNEFKQVLISCLKLNEDKEGMRIQYQIKPSIPALEIIDDMSLSFFLELKRNSNHIIEYPLCITTFSVVSPPDETSNASEPASTQVSEIEESFESNRRDDQLVMEYNPSVCTVQKHDQDEKTMYLENITEMAVESIRELDDNEDLVENAPENMAIWDSKIDSIHVGQTFRDKSVLQEALSFFAIKNNFQFRTEKSCPKQLWLICFESGCPWIFRASKRADNELFVVRKYYNVHTCDIDKRNADKRQATRKIIAKVVKNTYLRIKMVYKPGDIVVDMRDQLGAQINYQKSWRAKEEALKMIRGSTSESYNELPRLLYMIKETNPGSVINLVTDHENRFKYLYMAMATSIIGWTHCRPVIVVDATFLKTCYNGALISTCAYDVVEKIFPLAFGIVDGENDASWEWFFRQMKDTFGERDRLVIVSDRHKSIEKASIKVFPDAAHYICMYHLLQNLKQKYKSKIPEMSKYFRRACKAYTVHQFEKNMGLLQNINIGIVKYLNEADYTKWSRVHAPANRYNALTSNSAESLNSVNKGAKDLPIATLVDYLRGVLQKLFYENRNVGLNTFTPLLEKHEKKLLYQYDLASKMQVLPSTSHLVSVMYNGSKYVIDMERKTCTCNMFQVDEIPCSHALAFIKEFHLCSYDFCSKYYTKNKMLQVYAGAIYPIPSKEHWNIPVPILQQVVLPPDVKPKAGRQKKNRDFDLLGRKSQLLGRDAVFAEVQGIIGGHVVV